MSVWHDYLVGVCRCRVVLLSMLLNLSCFFPLRITGLPSFLLPKRDIWRLLESSWRAMPTWNIVIWYLLCSYRITIAKMFLWSWYSQLYQIRLQGILRSCLLMLEICPQSNLLEPNTILFFCDWHMGINILEFFPWRKWIYVWKWHALCKVFCISL